MRVLVLGGYGLVGLAASKRLIRDGHSVVGLARSANRGKAFLPTSDWIEADISKLTRPRDWLPHLINIDVVVNAAGVLQNGLKDSVSAVQRDSITALIEACEQIGVQKFIQISAPDADENADTLFYRTKGAADKALKASSLQWTVFRPGLVIAPHAYGGTGLIRMLAAFPVIQPIIMAKTPIQTISIDDVESAISLAVRDDLGQRDFDLVEPNTQTLGELVLGVRSWLGFANPRVTLELPNWIGQVSAKLADIAGWLGWRPALRTTTIAVLSAGVTGDPRAWEDMSGHSTKTFAQTLTSLPATAQERIYARAMLAFPVALLTLAGFWIASGVVGLMQYDKALAVISSAVPETVAKVFVASGATIDILIGLMLLFRPTIRSACFASIFIATAYLLASVVVTPELWVDPLGPMVKVFPAIALALILAALAEER